MAFSATNLICFICFLTLIFSEQSHARESQFFSKVPSSNGNNNYVQVTPNDKSERKQDFEPTGFVPENQKTTTVDKQQEPSFIPESGNGYGLYGQENNNNNNQFPTTISAADVKYAPYTTPITSTSTGTFEPYTNTPTTTTSAAVKYKPYTTPITSTATGTFEPYSTTPTTRYYNNNYKYYNNNGFGTEQESLGDSKFRESSYAGNVVEKQGMSDTRFLEHGKYYHDIHNENNYFPNQYQSQQRQNSRSYYNGNTYDQYNNNNNNMENYQNEENEFDELP